MSKLLKRTFFILLNLLLVHFGFSQSAGNEWINLNQEYYRIDIPKTGLYKLTKDDLITAGVPIGNYNPQNLQLFFKGTEIPCYIYGETNGDIQYLVFFAEKNDGWLDEQMYILPENQINPYYSLINDTASVFITWNNSYSNKRFSIVNDNNFVGYQPASYCWSTVISQFVGKYYTGANTCEYTEAEGWADNTKVELGKSLTKTISTPNVYSGSVNAIIAWSMISVSSNAHHITIDAPGFYTDTIFRGYKTLKSSAQVAASNLAASNNIIFGSVDDMGSGTDYSAVSFIKVEYPMQFDFQNLATFNFEIPASVNSKTYLEIKNFNHGEAPIIYDLTNNKQINAVVENNVVKALIPASSLKSHLIITNPLAYSTKNIITKCNFTDYASNNKTYVIITNRELWNDAQAYKNYRNALLVDVDNLYNQFGYGIQKHPLAIRNFVNYIQKNWTVKPEYLLLLGKGVSASGDDKYAGYRKNEGAYANCLVPPMGNPATDVLLSVNPESSMAVSTLYTGRVSATTGKQVTDYLSKVSEFEQNSAAEWMKNVIHFGGGGNTQDQTTFAGYLRNYENTIEDTLFGGYVSTFLKSSSDPIEITQSDSVDRLINNGTSIITFFGHGTTSGFDQNIDEPSAFLNYGKYPLIIANSCYSGNIFYPGLYSASEDWIMIANKGAIGFLAMVNEGIAQYLNLFSSNVYLNISKRMYGESLGKIINATRKQLMADYPTSIYMLNTAQEFTLHGDPVLVLNSFPKPDLYIGSESVSFTPSTLSVAIDSFYLNIELVNIAKATSDTFVLAVSRTFQDGARVDTQVFVNGLKYKKEVVIKYPIDQIKGLGVNSFFISVDANKEIDELDKTNNTITVNSYVSSADLVATVPYNYSLLPESPSALKAVTGDPFAKTTTSTFQLDTSYKFNSPFLISENINHDGGVVEWNPPVSYDDSRVYYWRTGSAKTDGSTKWSTSSFCYKNGKTGWIQSGFGQLKDNGFNWLEPNESTNKIDFITTPKRLSCYNFGSPASSVFYKVRFAIDEVTDYSSCGAGGAMLLVVIDTLSLKPWESNKSELFGNANYPKCSSRQRNDLYFVFSGTNEGMNNLANVVNNYVPNGFYILIYSFNRIEYQAWNEGVFQAFESWGASNIRFQANNTPYIFYTVKGDISQSVEVLGTSETDIINLNVDLKNNFVYGDITSLLIGPSQNWEIIEWDAQKMEANPQEINYLKVYGVDAKGQSSLLQDSVTSKNIDISDISATAYPYLKLGFHTRDEVFKTPSQLDFWSVQYSPLTDLVINPQKGYEFYSDTLQEGEIGKMTLAFENIGHVNSDSLLVKYWLQNAKNKQFQLGSHRLAPLLAGESISDTITFNTMNYAGDMHLFTQLNPVNSTSQIFDQPEQNYFNNLAKKSFFVAQDDINPVLDVTFDGMHIMDGDIVSAKPQIIIQLKDENSFIAIDDTASMSLYLKSQNDGSEVKLSISNNDQITFVPAELPKNKAQIIYQPEFTTDGIYELRVRAKDATGNESGSYDYQISFEVINESTITNVFNYPNPFSTSTCFVFELTGSEVPDEIRIDILTVTGKIVKIIYAEDLGPLNIGKNITTYKWDGRDMYGDPLANGVYFYKVSFRLNGQELKNRDTGTSKFFKNGYGKMYLMR